MKKIINVTNVYTETGEQGKVVIDDSLSEINVYFSENVKQGDVIFFDISIEGLTLDTILEIKKLLERI